MNRISILLAAITIGIMLFIFNSESARPVNTECVKPIPPEISIPGEVSRYAVCLESVIGELQAELDHSDQRSKHIQAHADVSAEATIDKMWDSFQKGSVEMFSETMARDEDMISFGTDVAERWQGWVSLKQSIEKQFGSLEVLSIKRQNKTIKYSQLKDTAWFSEVVSWEVMNGGEKALIEGIRFTGVLEKRGTNWLIVQFHTSVGVAGQVIEY